jgi:hypothetical protein
MPSNPAPQLTSLARLSPSELRVLWQKAFGNPAPLHAQRDLLVCCLTYRRQEQASGGMRPATRRQLLKLAQDLAAGTAPVLLDTSRIKPGTRLVREWQGKTHEVTVVEGGFRYRDKQYASLSEIARLITGTR